MSIVTDDIHNDNAYMILKKKIVARGFNDSDFKCRLKQAANCHDKNWKCIIVVKVLKIAGTAVVLVPRQFT